MERIWPVMLVLVQTMLALVGFAGAQVLHPVDLLVLQAVKDTMEDLPGGNFFSNWEFSLFVDPCASFSGVQCVTTDGFNRVSYLSLGPDAAGLPGLLGTLTPLIGNLIYLTQFTISAGAVKGTLPDSLGNLQNLQLLAISQNSLSGGIPGSFGNLKSLRILDLSRNHLEGSIPWGIGQLPALNMVILADNGLSGSIPSFSSNALTHLDLRNNDFSGGLPTLPPSLQFLSLTRNSISGWLGGLASLSSLTYLDVSFNQFSGPIPSNIFSFPLSFLLLNRNQLTGPVSVAGPISISLVDLSFNDLEGEISPFLAGAQSLFLNNNFFVGAVPKDFVACMEATTLQSLYLQHNYLTDFGALTNASLPPSVAVCVQYNCVLPPPQSLCPEDVGRQASRPGYQCLKVSGTQP